jgi:GTPase SAR1 family protein
MDSKTAVTASHDDTLRAWDIDSGEHLRTFFGHSNDVNSVVILPDGSTIASASYDHTIKFWALGSGQLKHTQELLEDALLSLTLDPSGTLLAAKSLYGRVIILRLGPCKALTALNDGAHNWAEHRAVAFSPVGSQLATTVNGARAVAIWEIDPENLPTDFSPQVTYSCAKIVLLGESGVGKTALAHRLLCDGFVPTRSTHGMNVWRIDLPLSDAPGLRREVWLWDLAGQAQYRLLHSLFLDQTSLAVLIFDPQKKKSLDNLRCWYDALCSATEDEPPPRLVVAARVDRGKPAMTQESIWEVTHAIASMGGYVETSAKTGLNCSRQNNFLQIFLGAQLRWGELPSMAAPAFVFELKDALLEIIHHESLVLARVSELLLRLQRRVTDKYFGEEEVRGLVALLANQGIVLPLF